MKDSIVHSGCGLCYLSMLHVKRKVDRAFGKDPGMLQIAEDVIEPALIRVRMLLESPSQLKESDALPWHFGGEFERSIVHIEPHWRSEELQLSRSSQLSVLLAVGVLR